MPPAIIPERQQFCIHWKTQVWWHICHKTDISDFRYFRMFKILSNTFKMPVPLPNIPTYQVPRPSPGTFAERPVDSHDLIALHDKHTISLGGNIRNICGEMI